MQNDKSEILYLKPILPAKLAPLVVCIMYKYKVSVQSNQARLQSRFKKQLLWVDIYRNIDVLCSFVAADIKDGNLKAILGLFFSLSRYKQQQKTQHQQTNGNQNTVSPSHTLTSSQRGRTPGGGRSPTATATNGNTNTEMLSRYVYPAVIYKYWSFSYFA